PAAGIGSRMQPLAFSKELLPVGNREEDGTERPRAVSEYLVERMILAGADRICFVISPGKSDILEYYGSRVYSADVCYAVQQQPAGLCDAIFRALPDDVLSFMLFPVDHPERFDAVVTDEDDRVLEIQVKTENANSYWIWGAFKMPGRVLHELYGLWRVRDRRDEYMGTLVNAWIA